MNDDPSLPPHAFIPGGPWSRPTQSVGVLPAITDEWRRSAAYASGIALFNAGYYWEAHEVWEGLWHAHSREGPVADLLKGLIKLAAAGVKTRQHQPHGIATHAKRAAALFQRLIDDGHQRLLGLDLCQLRGWSEALGQRSAFEVVPLATPVAVVFDFKLEPDGD
jgi:predicted metal-dependent hydrolase